VLHDLLISLSFTIPKICAPRFAISVFFKIHNICAAPFVISVPFTIRNICVPRFVIYVSLTYTRVMWKVDKQDRDITNRERHIYYESWRTNFTKCERHRYYESWKTHILRIVVHRYYESWMTDILRITFGKICAPWFVIYVSFTIRNIPVLLINFSHDPCVLLFYNVCFLRWNALYYALLRFSFVNNYDVGNC
jgi:hypothetical protein